MSRAGGPRVAFAGVAHSHAFADAENLRARGAQLVSVWDADDRVAAAEFRRRFPVADRPTLDALLDDRPDVVVVTARTHRAAAIARRCRDARTPAFFNKTVAADHAGIDAWTDAAGAPRFTASVLRFAPGLVRFAHELGDDRVHALDIVVQQDIAGFLRPGRTWQDDPAGAGGTLVNVGIHAWEMFDVLLPGVRVDVLSGSTLEHPMTASELIGTVHGRADSTAVSVTVSGVAGPARYAVRALTDTGFRSLELATDPDSLGYGALADGILTLAADRTPLITDERSRVVCANTVEAARLARRTPLQPVASATGSLSHPHTDWRSR
jgi:predicted dehydrogenase